jgi:putative redox protein
LRFDFTGLGESDGDFADTNFSGNVADLVAAGAYLAKNYSAPSLIVGHSLGGAAAIYAASQLDSIKAVATVGAPSNPIHVQHLFKSDLAEINKTGKARVNLGGRDFTIKKQFIEDLETQSLSSITKNLRKALLIMHSPQDTTVGIKNAEELYHAAIHPKSFVSLDGADHLLMDKKDSTYVGNVIAGWAKRYISVPENKTLKTEHQVVAHMDGDAFVTQIRSGNHSFIADEPESVGGNNFGPSPYELVSSGLAACTAMTIRMYANLKKWDLQHVEVHVDYGKIHAEDCADCETKNGQIDVFERQITLSGKLDDNQKERILKIANKCPVHKTLHQEVKITTTLI